MALPKLFQRIFWHNNTTPAINEDNLNAMSKAIDDIDDRVIEREGTIMEAVANANTYAENAAQSATQAQGYATAAQGYMNEAEGAVDDARGYAEDAQGYVADAQGYATSAQGYAAESKAYRNQSQGYANESKGYRDEAMAIVSPTVFTVDFETGLLMYTNEDIFDFAINTNNGNLEWEVESA